MNRKFISKKHFLASMFLFALSSVTFANDITSIDIPTVEDAHVFGEFTDNLPAVLTYFTALTKQQVINFYGEKIGPPISEEIKRDRLTLIFVKELKKYTVVISQQNNKRQVDIIVQEYKE